MVCAKVSSQAQGPAQVRAPVHVPLPTAFDPATLDPSVVMVISGGRWDTGAQRGSFRVVMLRGNAGPLRRRVVVQWLEEQRSTKRIVVSGGAPTPIRSLAW
jgi:hypothetical protein